MIQPKDVIVLPISSQVHGLVRGTLFRLLPTTAMAIEAEEGNRLGDSAEDNFALITTCVMAQAEALSHLIDLLVEPGTSGMLVGVKVREEVRRRVRDVFVAGGEA